MCDGVVLSRVADEKDGEGGVQVDDGVVGVSVQAGKCACVCGVEFEGCLMRAHVQSLKRVIVLLLALYQVSNSLNFSTLNKVNSL